MRKVLLVILLLIAISCKTNEIRINDNIINELAQGDFKIPSAHGFSLLFVSAQNEDKACTSINVLHEAFVTYYIKEYPNFKAFLSHVLSQKRKFSQEELDKWKAIHFKLNTMIEKKYNSLDMPDFIKAYFDNTVNKQKFVVKTMFIDKKYLYSILYYCFINNYKVTLDDYLGKYYITTPVN